MCLVSATHSNHNKNYILCGKYLFLPLNNQSPQKKIVQGAFLEIFDEFDQGLGHFRQGNAYALEYGVLIVEI